EFYHRNYSLLTRIAQPGGIIKQRPGGTSAQAEHGSVIDQTPLDTARRLVQTHQCGRIAVGTGGPAPRLPQKQGPSRDHRGAGPPVPTAIRPHWWVCTNRRSVSRAV